jgi:hypothetical protein
VFRYHEQLDLDTRGALAHHSGAKEHCAGKRVLPAKGSNVAWAIRYGNDAARLNSVIFIMVIARMSA